MAFPEDQVSDASDRMMAAEVTREQLYLQLHAELPYASAVETEKYEERKDGSVAIHQQILVGRDSQKAIVLGKGGTRIKEIGATARAEIAACSAARSTSSSTSRSARNGRRTAASTATSGSTGWKSDAQLPSKKTEDPHPALFRKRERDLKRPARRAPSPARGRRLG